MSRRTHYIRKVDNPGAGNPCKAICGKTLIYNPEKTGGQRCKSCERIADQRNFIKPDAVSYHFMRIVVTSIGEVAK